MNKKSLLKKICLTCAFTLMLPKVVFAANDLFIQSCEREDGTACPSSGTVIDIEAGETVKIIMSVETDKKINGFASTIGLENMSNVSDFTYSNIWGSDSGINGNTFLLMRDPGNIPDSEDLRKELGNFKVTAGNTIGNAKITFEDIDATYLDGGIVEDYNPGFIGSISFNVVESSNPNPNNNNTNNNSGDSSKTQKENPQNPKTGIGYSFVAMTFLLVVCGVCFIIIRKKKYFNKI